MRYVFGFIASLLLIVSLSSCGKDSKKASDPDNGTREFLRKSKPGLQA